MWRSSTTTIGSRFGSISTAPRTLVSATAVSLLGTVEVQEASDQHGQAPAGREHPQMRHGGDVQLLLDVLPVLAQQDVPAQLQEHVRGVRLQQRADPRVVLQQIAALHELR